MGTVVLLFPVTALMLLYLVGISPVPSPFVLAASDDNLSLFFGKFAYVYHVYRLLGNFYFFPIDICNFSCYNYIIVDKVRFVNSYFKKIYFATQVYNMRPANKSQGVK